MITHNFSVLARCKRPKTFRLRKKEKLKKQKNIAEKRAQIVINKVLKKKAKVNRFLFAAEKRRLKKEAMKTKAIEKQTQNKLKIIVFRSRQLIVKLKMPIKDLEKMKNDQ